MAARLAASASFEFLPAIERQTAEALRAALSPEHFARLPELVASRRLQLAADAAKAAQERGHTGLEEQRQEWAARAARARAARERELAAERAEAARLEQLRRAEDAARAREKAAHESKKRAVVRRLNTAMEQDYLGVDQVFPSWNHNGAVSQAEFELHRTAFVKRWLEQNAGVALDDEQAAAVATTDRNVQVVARAGSGKTRTIVARAIFLQKHCGVSPREILLLAFNVDAADSMKARLAEAVSTELPHVMTFHALAHAIVHPDEALIYDDASADQLGLSRAVQEVIDAHLRSPEHRARIRDLMLAQFRDDWEQIVEGHFELGIDEFLAYRRSLQRESLNGEFVKSFGERLIANTLFEHGVAYRYERNFHWGATNYRPDFTVLEPVPVVIEYFGIVRRR